MINIIGVGEMGCKLATEFAKSEHYDVYKIGIDLPKNKRSRGMKKQTCAEKYEQNCPPMKHFLKELSGRSILLVNGGEAISAVTLRVLENCRPWATTVAYIEPDRSSLNEEAKLQALGRRLASADRRPGSPSLISRAVPGNNAQWQEYATAPHAIRSPEAFRA